MLWRAPWLRARSALLGLGVWDAACIYICYRYIAVLKLREWMGVKPGLAVIWLAWISASYLVGRYSKDEVRSQWGIGQTCALTVIPAVTVAAIFIGHSWLYQITDAATRLRGFLVPLLIGCSATSIAGQIMVERILKRESRLLILCTKGERDVMEKELRGVNQSERTRFISEDELQVELRNIGEKEVRIAVGERMLRDLDTIELLLSLREEGVRTITTIRWCEERLQRIPPELIDSQWLVQAEGFSLRPGSLNWRIKRLGDIIGAAFLLVVTSPLITVAAILIYAEDRGPIFYAQERTGLCGQIIKIWKLRSMRTNAEESGAQWAKKNDPRITRVGSLIRATRIDELPQLVGVLLGELSLIGPRPERPEFETILEQKIPHYRVRHWIRPGLSGWAQVCYPYGSSVEDSRQKLSYDLYYLRNSGMLMDALIVIKTIRLIARKSGSEPRF